MCWLPDSSAPPWRSATRGREAWSHSCDVSGGCAPAAERPQEGGQTLPGPTACPAHPLSLPSGSSWGGHPGLSLPDGPFLPVLGAEDSIPPSAPSPRRGKPSGHGTGSTAINVHNGTIQHGAVGGGQGWGAASLPASSRGTDRPDGEGGLISCTWDGIKASQPLRLCFLSL